MEKHRLILHLGTPKTGTSALQKFLYDNRKELSNYGFCYPDLVTEMEKRQVRVWADEDERYKNGLVFNAYINSEAKNTIDISRNNGGWRVLWDILKDMLRYNDVIVSEESIWWWDTKAVLEAIKKEWDNICVIFYLRRQDRYIESDWNQRVKRYGFCCDTFADDIIKRKNNPIFKYVQKLEEIEAICGINNIIVRVYEKQQFEGERGDIVSDFLESIGCNIDLKKCIEAKVVNQSLSGNMLEIKRTMNTVLKKGEYASRIVENMFLSYLNAMGKKQAGAMRTVESYYTDEQRKAVLEGYRRDNEYIAKRYLKREDGVLFYEDVTQGKSNETEQDMYEDIIKVFTSLLVEQQRKIQQQQTEIYNMVTYKMLDIIMKRDGREVIAFGAGAMCKDVLVSYDLPVKCIVDNNKELKGSVVAGRQVVHVSDIAQWNDYFVFVCCRDADDIEEQLKGYGLKKDKDYILAMDYMG